MDIQRPKHCICDPEPQRIEVQEVEGDMLKTVVHFIHTEQCITNRYEMLKKLKKEG